VSVTAAIAGGYVNTLATGALQTDRGSNAVPVVTTLIITPRVLGPAPAPTLSPWGLMMLTALLALVAFAAMRRQAM
jgi:hypothetical protein